MCTYISLYIVFSILVYIIHECRYSLHRFLQLHYIRVFCYQQRSYGVGAARFVVLKASSAIGKPWWPQEFWINAVGSACKSIWSISISNIITPLCFACFKQPHVYHQDWVYIVVTLALLNRHQWRGVLVREHPIGLVGLVSLKAGSETGSGHGRARSAASDLSRWTVKNW